MRRRKEISLRSVDSYLLGIYGNDITLLRNLHQHELFDEPGSLADWISGTEPLNELAGHLNDHIRVDSIGSAVESAARLGFKATRDGSPLRFFLRVGGPKGASVGVVGSGDESYVAIVVRVPGDWDYLGGVLQAKAIGSPWVDNLRTHYEQFERDAHTMMSSEVPLPDPGNQPLV